MNRLRSYSGRLGTLGTAWDAWDGLGRPGSGRLLAHATATCMLVPIDAVTMRKEPFE